MLFLRVVSVVLGLSLIYVALFLREDEEGRLQNLLATAWIQIDDNAKRASERFREFLRQVCTLSEVALRRLFGDRSFSLQVISGCVCFAFASYAVIECFDFWEGERWVGDWITNEDGSTTDSYVRFTIFGAYSILMLTAGFLPSIVTRAWAQRCTTAIALIGLALSYVLFDARHFYWIQTMIPGNYPTYSNGSSLLPYQFVAANGLAAGFVGATFDLAWLALYRFAIAKVRGRPTFVWTGALFLLSALGIGLMFAFRSPASFGFNILHQWTFLQLSAALGVGIFDTRLFTSVVSTVVAGVVVVLLIHRLLWPVSSRIVYPLQRFGVFQYRRTIVCFGISLVLGLSIYDVALKMLGAK